MEKTKRIMFLDLMRVIALFMMIQGHTIYDFLDLEIREGNSTGINIWTSLRGYTAPFFMLVSGAVFTFLMISQAKADGSNPRIKAGLKRIFSLLFWGYMLNFPLHVIVKIFTEDGYNRLKQVNIIETFSTILWISVCLFLYKSLMYERSNNEKRLMKLLFNRKALVHMQFRTSLFRKSYFTTEEIRKRVNSSFFWGLIISIPFLIISNELTQEEIQRAFRVDVLHLIAIGLLLIMLIHSLLTISKSKKALIFGLLLLSLSLYYYGNHFNMAQSNTLGILILLLIIVALIALTNLFITEKKLAQGLTYLLLAVLIIGLYPMVNNVKFDNLHSVIAPYLNTFETGSQFPITPWVSYIMMGAVMGTWLSYEVHKENFERHIGWKLAIIGIFFLSLSYFGDLLEQRQYGQSYYWVDSPNLIYHRIGVVISVGAVMGFISLYIKQIPKVVSQMTRNTLWLYVGHLVIIYQIVKPLIGTTTRFSLPVTLLCVVLMFFLMYLQTQVIIKQQKKGGYLAWAKSLLRKKSEEIDA
jgi:uncharacterized membrane protein